MHLPLASLREKLGVTQTELAKRLNISQPSVSHIESSQNLHVSTLKKYVEALGCTLEIVAKSPGKKSIILFN